MWDLRFLPVAIGTDLTTDGCASAMSEAMVACIVGHLSCYNMSQGYLVTDGCAMSGAIVAVIVRAPVGHLSCYNMFQRSISCIRRRAAEK